MLMKFLEIVMNRGMLDRLAFPIGRSRIGYDTDSIFTGTYIASNPYYDYDPWEMLERYLEG
jgi:hypothetical protein